MSSNIRVRRICQHCNTEFTAKTTVTQYCSDKCSKQAYKKRIRTGKIEKSNKETSSIINSDLEAIKQKEYLRVKDASELIGCSSKTIYRLIVSGSLPASNIGERLTRIRRGEVDKLLSVPIASTSTKASTPTKKEAPQSFMWPLEECYSINEAQAKYNVSSKALNDVLKRNAIPKRKEGWYTYVPKTLVDELLS